MTKENERNSIFAIPLLYNAGSAVCIKVVSVMELLSAINRTHHYFFAPVMLDVRKIDIFASCRSVSLC